MISFSEIALDRTNCLMIWPENLYVRNQQVPF